MDKSIRIGVIGLGYVGLPLAYELSTGLPVTGYDINSERVTQLKIGIDKTHELSTEKLNSASDLTFTDKSEDLSTCNFYIVPVPPPIDEAKVPDLNPLKMATE